MKNKITKDQYESELAENFGNILHYTVNESIILNKMKKYYNPQPAELFKSKKDEKRIMRNISKISEMFGGPPLIVFVPENQKVAPKYDTFLYAAIYEVTAMFQRSYNSICIAHLYFICKGLLENQPKLLTNTTNEELKKVILPMINKQFYEKSEIAYIRLSSYWDRVGQLLDFIFFNIRQYERDVFSKVLDRIKVNVLPIHPEIAHNESWVRLRKYQTTGKSDGMNWLFGRRNLLVHSLHFSSNYHNINANPIFEASYNHLKASIENRLKVKNEQEEINLLHTHLQKAAELFSDVIELCLIGAKNKS